MPNKFCVFHIILIYAVVSFKLDQYFLSGNDLYFNKSTVAIRLKTIRWNLLSDTFLVKFCLVRR